MNKKLIILFSVLIFLSLIFNCVLFRNYRSLIKENKFLNDELEGLRLENKTLNDDLEGLRLSYDAMLGEFEKQDKSLVGYWVYGKDVIQINKDNSFIWVECSDKSNDRYIIKYITGVVDDNTLIFNKVYESFAENNRNNRTRYYKPEQIPETAFIDSTSSRVMNMMTDNVFVLSIGDHMTQYSFTRQKDYELKYSNHKEETNLYPTIKPNNVSGTFEGTAVGMGGESNPVKVSLTLSDGKITDVKIEGVGETVGIGSKAIEELPVKMIENNSIEVDGVSGATYTSNAIKEAAAKALKNAGIDME